MILRHGKAAEDTGEGDEQRPLTRRGQRAARHVGELLTDRLPDLVLASTAVRTRETVQYFQQGSGPLGRVEFLSSLYLAGPAVCLKALAERGLDATRVLLVGHNPGLEELVTELTGERVTLPTAGLAECALELQSFADITRETRGELVALRHPRDDD